MIRIERDRATDEGRRIRPSDVWFDKSVAATNLAKQEGGAHVVMDLYKDSEVKMALEELFHNKCAYCESKPSADGPWDVEHYRPKGRVAESPNHPGYYWLAYTWDNLLPSCVFCNQRKVDQPLFDDPVALPAAGKLDQFPLEDETGRAMTHDDLWENERPLLLHPCKDDPEKHFTYNIQGQILAKDTNDQRAKGTIKICHLTRRRLRKERAERIKQTRKALEVLNAIDPANTVAKQVASEFIEMMIADNTLYAGVARAVVRDPAAFGIT